MASPINLGSVFRTVLWSQMQAQAGLIVLHYRAKTQAGTGGTEEAVANAVQVNFGVTLAACESSLSVVQGVIVNKIYDPLGQVTGPFFSTGPGNQGALAGDPLPKQVCGIITKRTGIPGGKGRGRCYVPFPVETNNGADGAPTAAYLVLLDNLVTQLNQTLLIGLAPNTTTLVPVIHHRALPSGSSEIIAHQRRARWATQRRRGDYGRSNVSPF